MEWGRIKGFHRLGAPIITAVLLLSSFMLISHEADANTQVMFSTPIKIVGPIAPGVTHGFSGGSGTSADPFILEGELINSSISDGIVIENVTQHLVIRNCIVVYGMENYVSGIKVRNSTNITISSCQVYRTRTGINISSSSCVSLRDNYVASTHTGYLLNINDSELVNCTAEWNGYYGMMFHDSNDNRIIDTSSSNNCGVLGVATGLAMLNSSRNIVENCKFDLNYGEGVSLTSGSNDNILSSSSLGWNVNGLLVSRSELNRVENCTFRSNVNGVNLGRSFNNTVTDCSLRSNSRGFYLYRSGSNLISGCVLESNEEGVSIFSSPSNRVIGNVISNGSGYGMVVGNRIGVEIRSAGNMIWGNHLIDNNRGNVQAKDQGTGTIWDSDGRGNLWSDLPGPDNDTDGVVDAPYFIDGGSSRDRYPIAHDPGPDIGEGGEREYSDGDDEEGELWMMWAAIALLSASILLFLAPLVMRRR